MGFTGALVTGVWIGNDDYRAMLIQSGARTGGSGVTGGSLPAQTWQSYMAVAHTSMNIATIPGLTPHPRQIQETERLATLKKTEPALAAAQSIGGTRRNSVMPDQTRDTLKRLADTMRKTAGLPEPQPDPAAQGARPPPRQTGPAPVTPVPGQPADRRADAVPPRTLATPQ